MYNYQRYHLIPSHCEKKAGKAGKNSEFSDWAKLQQQKAGEKWGKTNQIFSAATKNEAKAENRGENKMVYYELVFN